MGLRQAQKLVKLVVDSLQEIEKLTGVKTKPFKIVFQNKPIKYQKEVDETSASHIAAHREYGGLGVMDGISCAADGSLEVSTNQPELKDISLDVSSALAELVLNGHALDSKRHHSQLSSVSLSKRKKAARACCDADIYQIIPGNRPVRHISCEELIRTIKKEYKAKNNDDIAREYFIFLRDKGYQAPMFIVCFLRSYIDTILEYKAKTDRISKALGDKAFALFKKFTANTDSKLFTAETDKIRHMEVSQPGKAERFAYALGHFAGKVKGPKELKIILATEPAQLADYANKLYQEAKRLADKQA
jgi:hypothetical protein